MISWLNVFKELHFTSFLSSTNPLQQMAANQYQAYARQAKQTSGSDSDDSDEEELPLSHEVSLPKARNITTLRFHPQGHSLYTATSDALLNCYDFQTLTPTELTPKAYEPYETHAIHTLDVSTRGQILALPADSQFKLLNTDGTTAKEFSAGDRYLFDAKQTKGHTDTITGGQFIREKAITSSDDSTIRVWDLEKGKQETVNFIRYKGKKTKVSAVVECHGQYCSVDNHRIAAWDPKKMLRPMSEVELEEPVVGIQPTTNGLLIRTENALKLYDIRNFSRPLIQRLGFKSYNGAMSVGRQFIATSAHGDGSQLHVLDPSDLMTISTIDSASLITSVDWNCSLNQIAYGDSLGVTRILFSPEFSQRGILTTLNNKQKKRHLDDSKYTTSVKEVAFNMEELEEMNRSKKRKPKEEGEKLIWGKTKISDGEKDLDDPRETMFKHLLK